MTWTLIRNDDAFGHLTKWTVGALALATQWVGWVTLLGVRGRDADPWLLLASLWLVPAVYLLVGPLHTRARDFHLGLPVDGRRLWSAHLVAVLLASGLVLTAVAGTGLGGLAWLRMQMDEPRPLIESLRAAGPAGLANVAGWWALLAVGLQAVRPGQAHGLPRRTLVRGGLPVLLAGLVLVYAGTRFAPWLAVLPLAAAVALVVRTRRRVPAALVLAPAAAADGPVAPPRTAGHAAAHRPAWIARSPAAVVLLTTTRHPLLLAVAYPLVAAFGWLISQGLGAATDEKYTGFLFLPITAYLLFTLTAAAVPKLALLDHLPLGRGRLMTVLIVPQLVALSLGWALGETLAARSGNRAEPLTFVSEGENPGLRLWPEHLAISWREDAPVATAPWGETHPVRDLPVLGDGGPYLVKPFTTPADASLDFTIWQVQRAMRAVFGRELSAAEIAARYLTTDATGRVVLRGDALSLVADHPDLVPRRSAVVPAVQILIIGALFLVALGTYLGAIRASVSERRRKWSFGLILAALLVVHLTPYALDIAGVVDPEIGAAFLTILGGDVAAMLPGGAAGLWLLVAAALGALYAWVLRRAGRMELPTPETVQSCGFGMGL